MNTSYYNLGIDAGSVAIKVVIFDASANQIVASSICPTGWNIIESANIAMEMALQTAKISQADIHTIVATGYGRISIPFAHFQKAEISCHALGAHHLHANTRLILDIGGQDTKAIHLDELGNVIDFMMNDKCAAGTGRFVQTISHVLDMNLEEFDQAVSVDHPVPISSTCTVFAETEIVGLLAQKVPVSNIAAGVLYAIAKRMKSICGRLLHHISSENETILFSGGMTHMSSFVKILGKELGTPLYIPEKAQFTGALGAALFAQKNHR